VRSWRGCCSPAAAHSRSAATRIGIAGLPQRWGASSVIVIGIAGVVGVLVAMLAMGEGFKATLDSTGSDDTAIVLRGGSQAETNSVITRDQVPLISRLAGIAKGADGRRWLAGAVAGREPAKQGRWHGHQRAVPRRRPVGLGAAAQLKMVEGRKFSPGLRELVAGRGAQRQFRGLEGRATTQARQPDVDRRRHLRIGRFARVGTVGGRGRAWSRPTSGRPTSR
jgi:putative ABC transport system permease protein